MMAIKGLSRIDPADVEAMANAMAAAVDARLSEQPTSASPESAASNRASEPAPYLGPTITESEVVMAIRLIAEENLALWRVANRIGVPVAFLGRFLGALVDSAHEEGWPRATKWMERVGVDLNSVNPATGKSEFTPYRDKRVRALWFWMQFFDNPKDAARDFASADKRT